LANDELVFTETREGVSISYKQYLKDEKGEERGAKLVSIIDGFYTQEGTNELRQIFDGSLPVPFPKPVRLIQKLIELITDENDIVLDSFAGSGTTAHAVMLQNLNDGGSRQWILVQMPRETKEREKDRLNICQEITAERARKVSKG
jgi:adenine-specific DNA-methyltransferase